MEIRETWISLEGLRLWGHHGVSALEQTVGGEFEVALRLRVRMDASALCDDQLSGTADYGEITQTVKKTFSLPSRLIENVAWRVAHALFGRFDRIEEAEVVIRKLNPPVRTGLHAAAVTVKAVRDVEKA